MPAHPRIRPLTARFSPDDNLRYTCRKPPAPVLFAFYIYAMCNFILMQELRFVPHTAVNTDEKGRT